MPKEFVSFAEVKSSVRLEAVLDRYGLRSGFTERRGTLLGPCPICSGGGKRGFTISLAKNAWYCFGKCKRGGNVLDFVALKEDVDLRRAAELLSDWFALGLRGHPPPREAPKAPEPPISTPAPALPSSNPPLSFSLKTLDQEHPSLAALGLSASALHAFGLGHCGKGLLKDRIAIPVHDREGVLVAYAGFASGAPEPYRFPPKFRPELEVWNLHRFGSPLGTGPLYLASHLLLALQLLDRGLSSTLSLFDGSLSPVQEEAIRERAQNRDFLVFVGEFEDSALARLALRILVVRYPTISELFPEGGDMPTVDEANHEASKLEALARSYGQSVTEFIETYALDEVVPAICMNPGCDYTRGYEPDQREGWCEECDECSMKGGLVLAGLV
jgi:hypothetical protein